MFKMETKASTQNQPQHDVKLPVVGSASKELVDCADCDYRHVKAERIENKGKVWTTYHCPKCGSESTCRVS